MESCRLTAAFGAGPFGRGDESVAVLGHGLNEAWPRGIIAEPTAQCTDALGQRLVGHGHAAPDFIHEAVLSDELATIVEQQRECIEVAAAHVEPLGTAAQQAFARIEGKVRESKATDSHSSVLPHF